ncbi:cytochrome b-c1 complex subunit 8 [Mucidula mucida]|nr:cytochrome b-c1 complex subunit 8 [Mucidula mucida]
MRPSLIRLGDMPGPRRAYNVWWGDKHGLMKQRGMYQYSLSPFQSKAAPHWARDYLFNGYRRLSKEAVYWVIPFGFGSSRLFRPRCNNAHRAAGYGVYTWANNYTEYHESKAGHLADGAAEGH